MIGQYLLKVCHLEINIIIVPIILLENMGWYVHFNKVSFIYIWLFEENRSQRFKI